MQVTDHIHALKIPFQITGPDGGKRDRFVYAYLIYGEEICLIDSGVANSERIIADYLQKTGRAINDIRLLILTHSHPDHIGSAAAIKRLSGCTVAAFAAERAWIENIDLQEKERPVPGFRSLVGGSVAVDRVLEDGDILDLKGGLALQVLHTPGHSAGSISLWMKRDRALFTADAVPVFGDMPIYQDIEQSLRSIHRLAEIVEADVLLSAWDNPRWGDEARRAIAEGRRYLQCIHECVQKAIGENPELRQSPMKLCSRVLAEMGLSPVMANPLVAASFLSSLKSCSSLQREAEKNSGGPGSTACMSATNYPYEDEDKIVWMKDRESLASMKFVLQKFLFCSIRTGPIRQPEGEMLIGYATLKKSVSKVDEKGFCRRIFTLQPDDMCKVSGDAIEPPFPAEAVDPLSVQAGKPGLRKK